MKRNAILVLWTIAVAFLALAVTDRAPIAFAQFKPQLSSTEPISSAATITPNNVTTFATRCRSIFIGGAGNITVDVADGGTNLAFNGLSAGVILPVRVKRVYATGTTTTGLLCLY